MANAKIGDIFSISWGYDQTNVNFYRIKALRGKTQAVIEPVEMKRKISSTGFMCQDASYNINTATLKSRDVFINDVQKGKIVKFQNYYNDIPSFSLEGHIATPYHGQTVYESWYA